MQLWMKKICKIKIELNYHNLVKNLCIILDEHEDDDIEGDKILSVEEFKKKALEKLEVYSLIYFRNNKTKQKIKELVQIN